MNCVPRFFWLLIISTSFVVGVAPKIVESSEPVSSDSKSFYDSKERLIPTAVEDSNSNREKPVGEASQAPAPILLKMKAGLLVLHRENNANLPLVTNSFGPGGSNIVNAKDLNLGFEPGLDASLGARIRMFGTTFDAEIRYFGINEWAESHAPLLRPANSLVVFKHLSRVAFLSTEETSVFAKYESELYNVEFNLGWYPKERIRVFIGPRYIRLDEDLRISKETFGTAVLDKLTTENDLLGGQLGIEGIFVGKPDGGFSIDGWAKVGYFNNDISTRAKFPLPRIGNLSARSSNDKGTLAVEFGIGVSYAFCRNITLSTRYQLLWLNSVALAPDQWPVTNYISGRISTATDGVLYQGGWIGVVVSW